MFYDPNGRKLLFAEGVSQKFKDLFAETVQFMNSKGTGWILEAIENHSGTMYIQEAADGEGPYLNVFENTIYWDPYTGVMTLLGIAISPATVLNHEADHALRRLEDPIQQMIDLKTEDEDYRNLEEKRIIQNSEQNTAEKHGEIKKGGVTRLTYQITVFFETTGPTTTKRKFDNNDKIINTIKNEKIFIINYVLFIYQLHR